MASQPFNWSMNLKSLFSSNLKAIKYTVQTFRFSHVDIFLSSPVRKFPLPYLIIIMCDYYNLQVEAE